MFEHMLAVFSKHVLKGVVPGNQTEKSEVCELGVRNWFQNPPESQDFPEEPQSLPSQTYPSEPDPLLTTLPRSDSDPMLT